MGSIVTRGHRRGESDGTVETTGRNTLQGQTATMLHGVENVGGSMSSSLLRLMKVLFLVPISLCMTSFTFLVFKGNNRNGNLPDISDKGPSEIAKVCFCRRRLPTRSV
jgi:magnesium-transporting ATPase (P-type)